MHDSDRQYICVAHTGTTRLTRLGVLNSHTLLCTTLRLSYNKIGRAVDCGNYGNRKSGGRLCNDRTGQRTGEGTEQDRMWDSAGQARKRKVRGQDRVTPDIHSVETRGHC